jgi:hypothetical protein
MIGLSRSFRSRRRRTRSAETPLLFPIAAEQCCNAGVGFYTPCRDQSTVESGVPRAWAGLCSDPKGVVLPGRG